MQAHRGWKSEKFFFQIKNKCNQCQPKLQGMQSGITEQDGGQAAWK